MAKTKVEKAEAIRAFKVFGPDWKCRGYQFELGKTFEHTGKVLICSSGFHACLKVGDCFSYYPFEKENKVAEVLIWGDTEAYDEDSKIVGSHIEIVRELDWPEVLTLANSGSDNTGHSNSGYRNSGNWNSGYRNSGNQNSGNWNSGNQNSGNWNSGYRNSGNQNSGNQNSGYRNSGNWNSGNWNSGNWNSGNQNSGNWNSGNRNSGDQNSGYRNSGAFCTENNPEVWLFDKPSGILVRDWEDHKAVQILAGHLETNIWIYGNSMTEAEKEAYPDWETTDGYLKSITLKEAWANMWPNLSAANKKVFIDLPNFTWEKFTEITGIKEGDYAKKS